MKLLLERPANHEPTSAKVAIVTGLSDPASTRLHETQLDFMAKLPVPEAWKIKSNFPFVATSQPSSQWPSLLLASLQNGRQFCTGRGERYRQLVTPHWRSVVASTPFLFLIVGSCGLEIVNQIPGEIVEGVHVEVLALGPVNLLSSPFPVTTIRGKQDRVSWLFHRKVDHALAGLGHMGYWCDDKVRGIAENWLLSRISELSVPVATCRNGD